MSTTMVHVRMDRRVKGKATKALAKMGLSVSDAVRMMLVRVAAEHALPFDGWQLGASPALPYRAGLAADIQGRWR
jgi:DNA-damage-inducible protein J